MESEYEYRIVLEKVDGTILPLISQGPDLNGAQERLESLLKKLGLRYVKGWLERRPLDNWETFRAAQVPGREDD